MITPRFLAEMCSSGSPNGTRGAGDGPCAGCGAAAELTRSVVAPTMDAATVEQSARVLVAARDLHRGLGERDLRGCVDHGSDRVRWYADDRSAPLVHRAVVEER